ncbi:MAG: epoxide hydrolase [Pseudomonadales bacterium]|nr:epoxide hydrolase [Pseudomonadales bacterium]
MFIKPVCVSRYLLGTAITALSLVFTSFTAGNPLDQIQQLSNKPNQNIIMNEQQERFADNNITPFEIAISDEDLQDLRERLQRTRLPDQLNEVSWEYGSDLDYMREILGYWQDDFDWREQERQLNQFDQFKTDIDGLSMHFIHQRSHNPDAIPLMIVHGWPGSVSEFMKIIGPLTDPVDHGVDISDAFHVIAPSLPGFGFSEAPSERGFSPERIALLLADLMERIGYDRYAIAGGDWGAIINRHLANHYPDRLIGMHSNMILAGPPADTEQRANVSDAENEARRARQAYMANEVAYQNIQGTKPQTLGYALADSPMGTAAWIIEKFHGWTDMPQGADGYLDNYFTKDELLTNVSIYWFTSTITSSTRIYYENRATPAQKSMEFINVPTGAAIFPAELFIVPRAWAEAAYDLRHWTVMEEGGHFAALEQPDLYLNDVREFFRLLR